MSVRRVMLRLLFGLTEACLIAPMMVLAPTSLRTLGRPASLGFIWMVLCAVAGTRRILAGHDASMGVQQVVMGLWLLGLVCIFVVLAAVQQSIQALNPMTLVIQFTCALVLWWRGGALGQSELTPVEAQEHFRNGLLLFGAYSVVTLLSPSYDLLSFLLPFLFSSLLALPISYLERVEQADVGQHVAMSWRWWRWVLVSAGLALLVAVAVMAVFTPDILNQALVLLIELIALPLFAVGYVLGLLFELLSPLLKRPQTNPLPAINLNVVPKELQQQAQTTSNPLVISNEVIFGLVIVLLAVIMLMMVLTTARARHQPIRVRGDAGEEDPGERKPDKPLEGNANDPARLLDLRRWLAGVTVRRVYARMIHEAAKRGYSRLPAQTPYDYIPQLVNAYPGADAEVHLVTDAYVAAHYGQVPDTEEELAQIRAAWERARAVPYKHASETKGGT